jgi:acyl dehydratase
MPPLVVENPHSLASYVGREIGTTEWFSVTQDRIQQFAETTEDRQWIHLDRERAQRDSPYGTTIAHGFLTLALVSHLLRQALQIASGVRMSVNYGLNRVRFPSPVPAGSRIRIRARFTLQALKGIAEGMEATFSVVIERENSEKPCCIAEWVIRYYIWPGRHDRSWSPVDQSESSFAERRAARSATLTTSGREAKRESLVRP